MITNLNSIARIALPALSGDSVTYNAQRNVYLTCGYTSAAGNTYYKAIRFSDRLAVYYDLGQGYAYTFLNGITLFAWNGDKADMIAKRMYNNCIFTENLATQLSVNMLKEYLAGQAKAMGASVSENELNSFSKTMIEATRNKLIS